MTLLVDNRRADVDADADADADLSVRESRLQRRSAGRSW
jgi:hypothetical protein